MDQREADWILGATTDPAAYDPDANASNMSIQPWRPQEVREPPIVPPLPGDVPEPAPIPQQVQRVYIGGRPDERTSVLGTPPPVPDDSKMALGSDPTPRSWDFIPKVEEARPLSSSLTPGVGNLIYDTGRALEQLGVPASKAYERGENIKSTLGMLPGTGSAINWGEAKEAYGRGDYGTAALNTAMAVPIVPAAAARPVAAGAKKVVKGIGSLFEQEAPAAVQAIERAPTVGHNLAPTGSLNPLDNIPVTFRGKQPREFTPEDWQAFGEHYGVSNLGPLSPLQTFTDMNGKPFQIPGGLEGKWTYLDALHMKANPINPANVDRGLHAEMQKKLGRTMTPTDLSDADVWNGLIFGMTSPNNPLFPNQATASRLRLRTPEMLDDLSSMIPWKPGDAVPAAVRKQHSDAIANRYGLGGFEKSGGLGTRGTADYTRVAEMAQLFRKDPSFFRKDPSESWAQAVERISSQLQGLSMKTGSFGTVWQDPAHAAISAIDRHMARELDKRGGIFASPAERSAWEDRSVNLWNSREHTRQIAELKKTGEVKRPADIATSFEDLQGKSGADGFMGEMLLDHVGKALTPKFRLATGNVNPQIPQHLAQANWVNEPQAVFKMGRAYRQALDLNQKLADEAGLNLFMSQWMEWDRIRNRFEPHENMFPGLSNLPAMSVEQMREVDAAHRATGHKTYGKDPEGALRPTRPLQGSPSRMGYLGIPGVIGGGALAGGLLGGADEQDRM
jgi:hypothetical protein